MAFGSQYMVDENYGAQFKEGQAQAKIQSVEFKVSSTGKDMAEVTLEILEQGTLRYWLVDDQTSEEAWTRTNRALTRFFDCFKIGRGNFNTSEWVGKIGTVEIAKGEPNENGFQYYEIKKFIVERPQKIAAQNFGTHYTAPQAQPQQKKQAAQPKRDPQARQQNYTVSQAAQDYGSNDDELDNIPF
ncbi:MAG: hypothetical protein P1P67_09425 [Treponema phagedenis]|uniref:hypothetical protein n=1 Tax=Treponema phagedenis TaxID=162 RepID=UPI003133EB45